MERDALYEPRFVAFEFARWARIHGVFRTLLSKHISVDHQGSINDSCTITSKYIIPTLQALVHISLRVPKAITFARLLAQPQPTPSMTCMRLVMRHAAWALAAAAPGYRSGAAFT